MILQFTLSDGGTKVEQILEEEDMIDKYDDISVMERYLVKLRSTNPHIAALVTDMDRDKDPMLKKVYADWLEDKGLSKLAHTYRYTASRNMHPYVTPAKRIIGWGGYDWDGDNLANSPNKCHMLPFSLFDMLNNYTTYRPWTGRTKSDLKIFKTVDLAFLALCKAIWLRREPTEILRDGDNN